MKHRITSLLPSTKKRGKKLTLDERIEKAMEDIQKIKDSRLKPNAKKKPTVKPKRKKTVGASRDLPTPKVIIKKKSVSVDEVC